MLSPRVCRWVSAVPARRPPSSAELSAREFLWLNMPMEESAPRIPRWLESWIKRRQHEVISGTMKHLLQECQSITMVSLKSWTKKQTHFFNCPLASPLHSSPWPSNTEGETRIHHRRILDLARVPLNNPQVWLRLGTFSLARMEMFEVQARRNTQR